MNFTIVAFTLLVGLFLGLLFLIELGRRSGIRRKQEDPEGVDSGTSSIKAAVFGLLGLLMAFTISGAASRLDHRREMIIEETNAIGTAFLRLDLLPARERDILAEAFRRYVDSRLEFYKGIHDEDFAARKLEEQSKLQDEIWKLALTSIEAPGRAGDAAKLLLPALNTMFDIRTTRTAALFMHPPVIVLLLLILLTLASAFLVGHEMAHAGRRHWVFIFIFAGILSVSVYIIVDLEYPRFGFIRVSDFDKLLVNLRANMN